MSNHALQSQTSESVFDNPLMTPPSTSLETGTWDADGSLRGWTVRHDSHESLLADCILDKQWTAHNRQCILLRITEYYDRFPFTDPGTAYAEQETYFKGLVHAPTVSSFPSGYCGVSIMDCNPDGDWFEWDERSWSNGYHRERTVRETAIEKTETLARGLDERANNE